MADDKKTALEAMWPQVLERVKARRRFTWILLSHNAQVQSYDGATLTLAWAHQGAVDNFTSSGSCGVLEDVLAAALGVPATVESVIGGDLSALSLMTDERAQAQPRVPAAITAPLSPLPPQDLATAAAQRALGQTAFLIHQQGDDRIAALLANVGSVELCPADVTGHRAAVLSAPRHLVPHFTDDVLTAIQSVFERVADRHGLRISGVTAACALPEIGDDWRHVLQAKLKLAAEAASVRLPRPRAGEVAAEGSFGCIRYAKTTGRRCRRDAAEWPAYDDLPSPVAACHNHLTAEEWEACQQARKRAWDEGRIRADADRDAHMAQTEQAADPDDEPKPCTGECISKQRAWGYDNDGAMSDCAKCDGWVCIDCGQSQVDGELEMCANCTKQQSTRQPDPKWEHDAWGEDAVGPSPQDLLTALVNDLVKATNSTFPQVNARINRTIGVASRVGADEQVIRRAVGAARTWLARLDPPA